MNYAGDEAQLISSCRLGDPDAWAQVWRRYYGLVAHLVRASGFFKPHEVEDICQEVFINLLDALQRFEGRGTLKSLLRIIAKRRVADAVRTRIRRAETASVGEDSDGETTENTVQPSVNAQQYGRAVLRGLHAVVLAELDRLPEDCRKLIHLRYGEGMKLREIAERLDRPIGSVGTQLQRCMTRLHETCLGHEPELKQLGPLLESWVMLS